MTDSSLHHLAAFSMGDSGGNPAGVWIGETLPADTEMQQIAAQVGASETAFIAPVSGPRHTVRYFSPEIEISFCGHATIASGVVLGRKYGAGVFTFDTRVGEVAVTSTRRGDEIAASLRSVKPAQKQIADDTLQEALDCLGWSRNDLDTSIPPINAYAGAWHYVISIARRDTLAALNYDFDALKSLMQRENVTTLQLVYREDGSLFHSRNPFPVGGIVEDPATGAAAAALGGYLRDADIENAPFEFEVHQGEDMGMPSLIHVDVPTDGGIIVAGTARDL